MSDYESFQSSDDESESSSPDFTPYLSSDEGSRSFLGDMHDLQHVSGEELAQLLPERFSRLGVDGRASFEYKEYHRVVHLLQSTRRWKYITLSGEGSTSASPEFLSLVVLALTKTNEMALNRCPMDRNFFACLNSGMQTLTHVLLFTSTIPISFEAATLFANGLVFSNSLEELVIREECEFEPGAALKLMDGIKRNNSLKKLSVYEANLGVVAMISFLRAVAEGCLPKLHTLNIVLDDGSESTKFLTKLMCSDACHIEELIIDGNTNSFRTDDVSMATANLKLRTIVMQSSEFDGSFLAMVLPRMPSLSELTFQFCGIPDISPIVNHLCRPNTVVKSINLTMNMIGIDQAENFVQSIAEMQSLTDVSINLNDWGGHTDDEERVQNMLRKVSKSFNLEKFSYVGEEEDGLNLKLNLAINRAWRRELCYNKSSAPSKLLALVIDRALRKTDEVFRADVILSLLRERINDLIPVPMD